MAGVNKAILIGNLGKDPQLDYTTSGVARCRFSLATGEQYTDRDGQRQERTEWHNVVLWNKLAEVAGEYLKKGSQVYVEGRISTRQYQDKEGQTKYITEIVGLTMKMLGRRGESGREYEEAPPPEEPETTAAGQRRRAAQPTAEGSPDEAPSGGTMPESEDDDLPF